MKYPVLKTFFCLIAGLFLFSCGPNDVNPDTQVDITIISPEDEKTYNTGEDLLIEVNFSHEDKIDNVRIQIVELADTSIVYSFQTLANAEKTFTHTGNFLLAVSQTTQYQIRASAWGLEASPDTVKFGAEFAVLP